MLDDATFSIGFARVLDVLRSSSHCGSKGRDNRGAQKPHAKQLSTMAFSSSSNPVKCGICQEPHKFFKLILSQREHTVTEEGSFWRICTGCERKEREREWESFTLAQREKVGQDYTAAARINVDMKKMNKGAV